MRVVQEALWLRAKLHCCGLGRLVVTQARPRIRAQERVPVNLFHKRAWEKLVVAADYPYFKWIETCGMQWLQAQTQAACFRWYD